MFELASRKRYFISSTVIFLVISGAKIEREDGNSDQSYKFPDLCYYMLTQIQAVDGPVGIDQINAALLLQPTITPKPRT